MEIVHTSCRIDARLLTEIGMPLHRHARIVLTDARDEM
jgi:hypothetical protein